jgi:hypothetical protein
MERTDPQSPRAFGRRASVLAPARRAPLLPKDGQEPSGAAAGVLDLSPAAEAFRAELAAGSPPKEDFSSWRRQQSSGRLWVWILRICLISPGALSFLLQAPWPVSTALEVAGVAVGFWSRAERGRRLKAIAQWTPEEP